MKKTLLFLLIPFLGISQIQIGTDINGEAPGDFSGDAISISDDGSTIAIGGSGNDGNGNSAGHARIYKLNAMNNWVQVGSDIDGEAAIDRFGASVSLSSNGNTVAIGGYFNDGNGSNSGYVQVYELDAGNNWVQIGADINGEASGDISGNSVKLSSDGRIVAIGAPNNQGANGAYSGHVRVYELDMNNNWVQLGADIDGENAGDASGVAISLSSNGRVLAVGAHLNQENGLDAGHVRVYELDVNNNWVQIGADINGDNSGDRCGSSVSLSSNGNILAIGSLGVDVNGNNSGHVRIYELDTNNNWQQIGTDIDGEFAEDASGVSVSLSSDGSTVAIGAAYNDDNGVDSGHVRIYKVTSGNHWIQLGVDIDGEAAGDQASEVSLSSNGNVIVIGASGNDDNGNNSGQVRVYDLSGATLGTKTFTQSDFKLYPNPVKDVLTVETIGNIEKIIVYDLFGKEIMQTTITSINMSDLAGGMYFVKVQTSSGLTITKQVVKQ